MAAEKTYNDLDVSLRKANEHRNEWFEGVQCCTMDETLYTILERIVRAEVHRLVIVDEQRKVIGIIALSDILLYLVLRPTGDALGGEENSLRASDPILHRKRSEEDDSGNSLNTNENKTQSLGSSNHSMEDGGDEVLRTDEESNDSTNTNKDSNLIEDMREENHNGDDTTEKVEKNTNTVDDHLAEEEEEEEKKQKEIQAASNNDIVETEPIEVGQEEDRINGDSKECDEKPSNATVNNSATLVDVINSNCDSFNRSRHPDKSEDDENGVRTVFSQGATSPTQVPSAALEATLVSD